MADGDPELDDDIPLDPPEEPEVADLDDEPEAPEDDQHPQESNPDDLAAARQQPDNRQPQREQQPNRRDRRIETLLSESRRKDQELADTRRRLDELTARVVAPQNQGETPEQRAIRYSQMSPQDIMQEQLRETEQRFSQQMHGLQMQTLEASDKAAFEAKATVDPLYRKWMPKVEGKLAEMRNHPDPRQRANVPREALLKFMIGEAALEARSKTAGKERAQAQQRVRSQTTRPANNRSDQPAERRQGNSVERRLENVAL